MKKKWYSLGMTLVLCAGLTGSAAAESVSEEESTAAPGVVQLDLFSLSCGEEWSYYEEYSISDSLYSTADLRTTDDEILVSVTAFVDSPLDFASEMFNEGLNAYEALVNDAYETVSFGGMDFYRGGGDYFYEYMGYDTEKNLYVNIYVNGDSEDERILELLNTLEITAEPYEGEPTPWYWDGEPYVPYETEPFSVGDLTVETEWLASDTIYPCFDDGNSRVAAAEDIVYVLMDGALSEYIREDGMLTYQGDWVLEESVSEIFTDDSGALYMTDYIEPLLKEEDDVITEIMDYCEYLTVHPSGTWAAEYGFDTEITVYDFENDSSNTVTLEDIDSIDGIYLTDHYIAVEVTTEEYDTVLKLYDAEWNELMTLSGEDTEYGYYGHTAGVEETENGLVVFDGLGGQIIFLDTELNICAQTTADELFGVSYYATIDGTCQDGNGNILAAVSDEREDGSCYETLIFSLSGF